MSLIEDFERTFEFEEIVQFRKKISNQFDYSYDDRLESLAEKGEMRKKLIDQFLKIDTFENRLKLIFNFQLYFNFFSEYPIEGFGKFSGYPTNEDQRLIFIDFLIKYIGTETIFFENIEDFYPEFRINKFHLPPSPLYRSILGYNSIDQIISEIQFSSEETTFIDQRNSWIQKLKDTVFYPNDNYYRAAEFFYMLYKRKEKFDEVVRQIDINKPYLFENSIFYRPLYDPYIKLLECLEILTFEKELWKQITLSKVYFKKGKFLNTELSNKNIYKIMPDGKLICLLSTQSKILLIGNLLKTPISKQDYKTIYETLLNFNSEIESIATQSTNSGKTTFIKGYVEKLNANITSLNSEELKLDFYIKLKNFIKNENFEFLSQSIKNELDFHLHKLRKKKRIKSFKHKSGFKPLKISNIGDNPEKFEEPIVHSSIETNFYKENPEEQSNTEINLEQDLISVPPPANNNIKDQKLEVFISKTEGFIFHRKMDQNILKSILDEHHDQLVKGKFINRCKTDFKSAYMGNKTFNKIIWEKSFPELRYYIEKLSEIVENEYIWVIASSIFLKTNGSEFSNKQLQKTQKGKGPIKKDAEIDDIFSDFYSILDK